MRFRMITAALGLAATVAVVATPALAAHNTPAKANKFLSLFVKAYNQCTSPVTTHNAPLSFGACTPTDASPSGNAHWGPKGFGQSVGVVKVDASKNATDVSLVSKFIDVRDGTDAGFNGLLVVSGTIRTTDNYCTPAADCTLIDVPFPVGVPCGSFASPALPAGKCGAKTSANTVLAGAVVPGHAANVELQTLNVQAGGETVFTEGLFLH